MVIFCVEHQGRANYDHFFNFNGTAGIWRRQAILDAGGWQSDTITEDLDLSYRSQFAGWRFAYLDKLVVPGELPETWSAFRTQQARWVRGGIQTAKKHLFSILWTHRQIPFFKRMAGAVHLLANFAYLLMALLALLLPVSLIGRVELEWFREVRNMHGLAFLDAYVFLTGIVAMLVFYGFACYRATGRFSVKILGEVLFALSVGAGMSLSNAKEVVKRFVFRPMQSSSEPRNKVARFCRWLRKLIGLVRLFLLWALSLDSLPTFYGPSCTRSQTAYGRSFPFFLCTSSALARSAVDLYAIFKEKEALAELSIWLSRTDEVSDSSEFLNHDGLGAII